MEIIFLNSFISWGSEQAPNQRSCKNVYLLFKKSFSKNIYFFNLQFPPEFVFYLLLGSFVFPLEVDGVSQQNCVAKPSVSARWGLSLMSSLNPLSYCSLYNFLCILLKNAQTYLKNLAVFTPQNFLSLFGHFSIYCMKGLYFSKTRTLTSKKFLSL